MDEKNQQGGTEAKEMDERNSQGGSEAKESKERSRKAAIPSFPN